MANLPLEELAELLDSSTESIKLSAAHEIRLRAARLDIWDTPGEQELADCKRWEDLENRALDVIVMIASPEDEHERHRMRIDLIRQARNPARIERRGRGDSKTDA